MKFIIKFFPEITIKSKSVRLHFIKVLTNNICNIFKSCNNIYKIKYYWDYLEILITDDNYQFYFKKLVCIPGIKYILLVEDFFFDNMYDIYKQVFFAYHKDLIGNTFCVRVKRCGKHHFTSQDIECYLGDMLRKNIHNTSVKLKQFDKIIDLEIKDKTCLLVKDRYSGLGGFPIGTQGSVLSLISGGFDSGIASYMLIRRGCKVHYCFFKIGDIEHEIYTRKIAHYLWKQFASSHVVKFITIDFSLIIHEILEKVRNSYMGVILKRMMIRAASIIAYRLKVSALITGEVLGQVSSQTLINLGLINNATNIMIFRPLIGYDKEEIISLSRKIGIEHFSCAIPEYCSIFSKYPIIKSSEKSIKFEEEKIDFSILDKVISNSRCVAINDIILEVDNQIDEVQYVRQPNFGDIIIDIRTQEEASVNPLESLLNNVVQIKKIPFYKLSSSLSNLDKSKTYLLYCNKGIISRWKALYLKRQGFNNIFIYLP